MVYKREDLIRGLLPFSSVLLVFSSCYTTALVHTKVAKTLTVPSTSLTPLPNMIIRTPPTAPERAARMSGAVVDSPQCLTAYLPSSMLTRGVKSCRQLQSGSIIFSPLSSTANGPLATPEFFVASRIRTQRIVGLSIDILRVLHCLRSPLPTRIFLPNPYTTAAGPPLPSFCPSLESTKRPTCDLRNRYVYTCMRAALAVEGYQGVYDGRRYGAVGLVRDVVGIAGCATAANPPRTTLLRGMRRLHLHHAL